MQRIPWREAAAEFLGTFTLISFGVAVVAQFVLSKGDAGSALSINLGWGLGVTMGVYVAGGISGAHLNPALTLAFALRGKFAWHKVAGYILAQLAGAFVASIVVYLVYRQALDAFDGGVRQVEGALGTAGIWATYPKAFLSPFPDGFLDQVVGTALLALVVSAISDPRNTPPPAGMGPVVVGLIVLAIGMTFGFNSGYAINPARDLAPRLFTAIAGWGTGVFTAGGGWWWVPIVAPCVGAWLGMALYDQLIGLRHPPSAISRN